MKIEITKNENHPNFFNVVRIKDGYHIGSIQKVTFKGEDFWDIDIHIDSKNLYIDSVSDLEIAKKRVLEIYG